MDLTLRCLVCVAVVGGSSEARAERDDRWHAGLNLRAELGAHPVRAGGGVQLGDLDLNLVVDPMFWTDNQVDTDLFATWTFSSRGWGAVGGVRDTAIAIVGGRQYQQKIFVGLGAPLPGIGDLPVRVRWAFEAAILVVKHGRDLPTEWISFASGRDFIDLVNLGMFVSFEYARPL